ncbi:hypothetical protein GGS24DRAFT_514233 [Hypoxylon argillaceum]|nr:hypothetical protein GGS24DRAFT_514233 [Hypoxylon argillaceum]
MDLNGIPPFTPEWMAALTTTLNRYATILEAHSCDSSIPPGPRRVTALSANSWRTPYPPVGQFAMAASEIIAAFPIGLFYFKRVRDHESTPWSEPRLLSSPQAMLDASSVSGLAIHSIPNHPSLYVYCVSEGVLHILYRYEMAGSSFSVNLCSPLSTYPVSGTPAVATTVYDDSYCNKILQWNLVVPCQAGGLLHTSTTGPLSSNYLDPNIGEWAPVDHVATDVGVISAVSIASMKKPDPEFPHYDVVLVAAYITSGRLYTLEGMVVQGSRPCPWMVQTPARIHHPNEVTGNPVLVTKPETEQLDLLVPSAGEGLFHFVRTESTFGEWHMIARITFPPGVPPASCLAFTADQPPGRPRQFNAIIQSGYQLHQLTTYEGAKPWVGSYLKQIVAPGPFSD